MPTTVSAAHARKNFSDLVNTVAYGGEPVILTRRGKKIAALISLEELELLQLLEERIDIAEARKALTEPGDNIAAETVWQELGL